MEISRLLTCINYIFSIYVNYKKERSTYYAYSAGVEYTAQFFSYRNAMLQHNVVSPFLFDKYKTFEIHELEIKLRKTYRLINIGDKNKSQLFTSFCGFLLSNLLSPGIFCSISGRFGTHILRLFPPQNRFI